MHLFCFPPHPTLFCPQPLPSAHSALKCEVNKCGGAAACDLQWSLLLTVWSHTHHIWVLRANFVQCWSVKDLDVNKSKSKQRNRISYHICHSASVWYTLSYFSMLSNPCRCTEQFGEWIIRINRTNKWFQIIYVWLERWIPTWHLSNGSYPIFPLLCQAVSEVYEHHMLENTASYNKFPPQFKCSTFTAGDYILNINLIPGI